MPGDHLLDLGRVPVAADVVGREALVALGKMRRQLRLSAGAADAALAVDDDVVGRDQASLEERGQGEDRRRRVAARVGDERGAADPVAEQLRQAVGGATEPLLVGMLVAVPFAVGRISALAACGRQPKTQSARAPTSSAVRSSSGRSSRPTSEGWTLEIGGLPSWRLVTATISASGWRRRILIASRAV